MSKSIPAALQTSLNAASTKLGWLVLITRPDGTQLPLSTVGQEITVNGVTYPVRNGFIPSEPFITMTGKAEPATTEIQVPTGSFLSATDIVQRLYDNSTVNIYLCDWSTGNYYELGFKWYIGGATVTNGGLARLQIYCDTSRTRRLFLKRYGIGCPYDLGDSRCGVDVAGSFTDTSTVTSQTNAQTFVIDNTGLGADGFYNYGAIKFTSGQNQGFVYTVRNWVQSTGTVSIMETLRAPLGAGDALQIHAGCDWRRQTCLERFSNLDRYGGFDFLPDDQANFSYPEPEEIVTETVVEEPITNDRNNLWERAPAGGTNQVWR